MATSHKILVIDDSGVIRRTVRDMLPAGFEVLEAKDGVEGLNLIRQEHPHWIMLDFILPKLSGWEVYQQIQLQPEYRRIPLVVMSGRKEEVTGKIPEPFEYFAFIEKPFDKNVLIEAIKDAKRKSSLIPAPIVEEKLEPSETDSAIDSEAIQELKDKITRMQTEIDSLKSQLAQSATMRGEIDALKKQMTQLVTFIKQKLK